MNTVSHAPDIDTHSGKVPRHIAIIMDGNNRWARKRSLPGVEGHRAGEQAVQTTIEACAKQGVEVLTLFAFSSENWRRPEQEVAHLMALFLRALHQRVQELDENNVRLRFIGEREAFNEELQQGMREGELQTANNTGLTVVIAVNYGGQWDVANAARLAAEQVAQGNIEPNQITDAYLGQYVQMPDLPPVDLLIRTGGDYRISNFVLWQAAYSELYFAPILWPDFSSDSLAEAIAEYGTRQRRFGRSGVEVEKITTNKEGTSC